ncbi:hypothetical protein HML84_05655 [Alcanivorax sp. IO_7]|nr:hypothetical protein HML84_05655 [Alcanivorax sp. IO_7]
MVLRFSESVEGQGIENSVVLRLDGQAIDTESHFADGGRSLILTPTQKLQYHSEYMVDFPDDTGIEGAQDIRFSTRAAEEGIKANTITADTLDVTRAMPSGGEQDPMMDFSTIRLQFTQPLDPQSLVYGQGGDSTVRLLDRNDDLVPAWVVVDGPYLTVDPKEDLTRGSPTASPSRTAPSRASTAKASPSRTATASASTRPAPGRRQGPGRAAAAAGAAYYHAGRPAKRR